MIILPQSPLLCDRRMPVKLKGKVYKTVIRPAMLYGAETWATTKRQEQRIEVTEMRMQRWMCGVTRKGSLREWRITERRLIWYGHERWRTHTEESVEAGYTREKEERTTENKMEGRVSTRFEK